MSSVFIDFDGTVCHYDVTDVLLRRFAAPEWEALEEDWTAGKIGARECMTQQISLIRAAPGELDACLDEISIDDAFPAFIKMLRREKVNVAIVSDGLDYSIRHILRRNGLSDLAVFSNHLVYSGDKTWRLRFPYKNGACPAGHCKCRRFDGLQPGFTLYIGDGASDFCPAGKAGLVLAKGRLADYCQRQRIDHVRVGDFADVMALWPGLHFYRQPQKQVAS